MHRREGVSFLRWSLNVLRDTHNILLTWVSIQGHGVLSISLHGRANIGTYLPR